MMRYLLRGATSAVLALVFVFGMVMAVNAQTGERLAEDFPLEQEGDVGLLVERVPMSVTIAVPLGVLGVQTVTLPLMLEVNLTADYSGGAIRLGNLELNAVPDPGSELDATVDFAGSEGEPITIAHLELPSPTPTATPTVTPAPTATPTPTATVEPQAARKAPACEDIVRAYWARDTRDFLEYRQTEVIGKWLLDWEGTVSDIDPSPPGLLRSGYTITVDDPSYACQVFHGFASAEQLEPYSVGQRVRVTGQIESIAFILGDLVFYLSDHSVSIE